MPEEEQLELLFKMPRGSTLEIRVSGPIPEDIDPQEQVEGVLYHVYWKGERFPMVMKTKCEAMAVAFGCQWAANRM